MLLIDLVRIVGLFRSLIASAVLDIFAVMLVNFVNLIFWRFCSPQY